MAQVVDLTAYKGTGPLVIKGSVWGLTNSTEYFRLRVEQWAGTTNLGSVLNTGWLGPFNSTWTLETFGPITLSASADAVRFIVDGEKPAGVGSYNQSAFDDAVLQVAVPEPLTLAGLTLSGICLAGYLRKRRAA